MKGIVLVFNVSTDRGLITGEDDRKYEFTSRDWQDRNNFPQAGQTVDFVATAQKATHIYFLPSENLLPAVRPLKESIKEPEITEKNSIIIQENAISKKQLLGLLGSVLLFIGVFSPIFSIPVIGSITYFQNGKGGGIFILILAVISLFLVLLEKFNGLWLIGLGSTLILTYSFIDFQMRLSDFKSQLEDRLATNPLGNLEPFKNLADTAMQSIQLQWGWALLMMGTILIFASAAVDDNRIPHLENSVTSFKGQRQKIGDPLKKLKPLEWIILAVIMMIVFIGISRIKMEGFKPELGGVDSSVKSSEPQLGRNDSPTGNLQP